MSGFIGLHFSTFLALIDHLFAACDGYLSRGQLLCRCHLVKELHVTLPIATYLHHLLPLLIIISSVVSIATFIKAHLFRDGLDHHLLTIIVPQRILLLILLLLLISSSCSSCSIGGHEGHSTYRRQISC